MSSTPPPPPQSPSRAAGSTSSAGQSVDEGKGRIFPCEQCGADLKFHIEQQNLECPYCGFEKELEFAGDAGVEEQDFRQMVARMRELHARRNDESDRQSDQADGQNEVRCEACGGTVVFVGSLTSTECPYCASPIQLDNVHDAADRVAVDGVLPFAVDKDIARRNLREWVNSRWFAPNDFLKRGVNGKFNGVYLPYWTFDSLTATAYSGQRGEHYWATVGSGDKKRRVRRTRWYPASGRFQRFFDDVLVLAVRRLPRKLTTALEPWPLGKCKPFDQQVLAGYLARTYETDVEPGFAEARERIDHALEADVRSRIGGDAQRIHSIRTQYGAITFKHLLLPVWLMAYRYHDRAYQVMVNAGTGEVQGERPYSWVKITLAVAGVLLTAAAAAVMFHA